MKNIIENLITFFIGVAGLIGGILWAYHSNWEEFEPIILIIVSAIEILGFSVIKLFFSEVNINSTPSVETPNNTNNNTNNLIVNFGNENNGVKEENEERKKVLTRILFVDDKHKEFRMVSILKKSGWTNTKSIKDITDLDDPKVLEANIIFVDINGVGTTLFQDQGLGLASALKKKYSKKKIFIYSADTNGDRFHRALREVDGCLPKNAEPYQFINLIQ